jgi:ribonuclease J
MSASPPDFEAGPDEILFVPLGGAHEIGMNLSLFGYAGQWLLIDCGVSFADEMTPGVELILPDPSFIAERRDKLAGILITHAHEDHIGAVSYLWRRLRRPVWCSPFASAMLRRKLIEAGIEREVTVNEFPVGGGVTIGTFEIESIPVTHSIPESQAIVLRTKLGTVLHATDWKLDPAPLVGPVTDEAALRRIGDRGVLAMTCDSTNVFVPGETGSEAEVRESLTKVIGSLKNRVAVTCFSSNIARIESIAAAAAANNRHVALIGRSMWTVTEAARECGYLATTEPFITEHEAGFLPRERALYILTGSQGEARSALARIAAEDHPEVTLDPGDTVIFSSRVIPGNEKAIGRLQNALARLNVEILTERDHFVHVSGHPARDDLARMYEWVRPRVLIPIHGETRHLHEHARYAESRGIPATLVAENGAVVRLTPGPAEIVGYVPTGRLAIDGTRLVSAEGEVLRMRRRMAFGGAAVATVVLDRKGRLVADPKVAVPGLLDGDENSEEVVQLAVDAVMEAIEGLKRDELDDDAAVTEAVRVAVRRSLRGSLGKRPVTQVQVVRLD